MAGFFSYGPCRPYNVPLMPHAPRNALAPPALLLLALLPLGACQPRRAATPDRGPVGEVGKVRWAPTPDSAPLARRKAATPVLKMADSCTHPSLAQAGDFVHRKGVTYREAGGQALAMDLMIPAGAGPHPVVLLVHGGGWIAGKRDEMHHEGLMLVEQGIAAALVDYRLAREKASSFPAAVQDLRCAVRFLRARARKHHLDPRRVMAMGPSSGGHLAALLATVGDDKRLDDTACPYRDQPASILGAVLFSAPLDLRPFMGPRVPDLIIKTFLGISPLERPDLAALASPITHLDPDDPPLLVVHGADDILVPPDLSRRFAWTLKALGIPSLFVEIPGAGHGFFLFKGTPRFRRSTCTTVGFIRGLFGLPSREPPPPTLPPREDPAAPLIDVPVAPGKAP